MTIQPIILCGGSGTRLWPISTEITPKQFIEIGSHGTLLDITVNRLKHLNTDQNVRPPILVMNKSHICHVPDSLSHLSIIDEPYANDTAVAIARVVTQITDNVTLLILPADHYIKEVNNFLDDISQGLSKVDDNIVLYGLAPQGPETKYGYILPTQPVTFKEKPTREMAEMLISAGALWNSGIVSAKHSTLKSIFDDHPELTSWVYNPRAGKAPSFDVAILQNYSNLTIQQCHGWSWTDVGTWDNFLDIPEIIDEMTETNHIIKQQCQNVNVLRRGSNIDNVVMIGCQNLRVIIKDGDILILSTDHDYSNDLKIVATKLNSKN